MYAAALVAASWFDDVQNLSEGVMDTGKIAGAALVVIFMLVAYALRRTLGAVAAAAVVGGLVLWGVNNTDLLQDKTEDTFISGDEARGTGIAGGFTVQ